MQVPFTQRILNLWLELPEAWRIEATSIWHTFAGVFAFQLMLQVDPIIQGGHVALTKEALVSIAVAVVRSATKQALIAVWGLIKSQWDAYKARKTGAQ